jgi:hypothetical protein
LVIFLMTLAFSQELKQLLEQSGISTSKGNKSSVLTCVADFILDLQRQNQQLAQHPSDASSPHVVGNGEGRSPEYEGQAGGAGKRSDGEAGGSDDDEDDDGPDSQSVGAASRDDRGGAHVEQDEEDGAGRSDGHAPSGVAGLPLRNRIDYRRVFHDQGVPMAITSVSTSAFSPKEVVRGA